MNLKKLQEKESQGSTTNQTLDKLIETLKDAKPRIYENITQENVLDIYKNYINELSHGFTESEKAAMRKYVYNYWYLKDKLTDCLHAFAQAIIFKKFDNIKYKYHEPIQMP